jgi:hypothetical protein
MLDIPIKYTPPLLNFQLASRTPTGIRYVQIYARLYEISRSSHKVQEHQDTKRNECAHNNSVPPLLRRYPPYQAVQAWHLTCRSCYPPVNTRQCFSLQPKALVHSIRLAEHTIRHVVAVIYPRSLVQHIFGFGGCRVIRVVRIYITPNVW